MKPGPADNSGKTRQRTLPIRFSEPACFRVIPVLATRKNDKQGGRSGGRSSRAFTLLELLLVITIVAMLAGMALPHLKTMSKSNSVTAATRQLLDDVAYARQQALATHSSVYMVFLSPNFLTDRISDPQYGQVDNGQIFASLSPKVRNDVVQTLHGEMRGYALMSMRAAGDQPGQPYARYLTSWRKLPEGVYIPAFKFYTSTNLTATLTDTNFPTRQINNFPWRVFPFPYLDYGANFAMPYLRFDPRGQCWNWDSVKRTEALASNGEFIPLTRGSVFFMTNSIDVVETPRDEWINNYNIIHIDGLTGRAKLDRKEIK